MLSCDAISPDKVGEQRQISFVLAQGADRYALNIVGTIPSYLKTAIRYASEGYADSERLMPLVKAIVLYVLEAYEYTASLEGIETVKEIEELLSDVNIKERDLDALPVINTMSTLLYAFDHARISLGSAPHLQLKIASGFTGTAMIDGKEYRIENGMYNGGVYIDVPRGANALCDAVTVRVGENVGQFNAAYYYNKMKALSKTDEEARACLPLLEGLLTYGLEAKEYVPHVFSEEYTTDASFHWHECTDPSCAESTPKQEHTYGENGVCECGVGLHFEDGEGEFLNSLGISGVTTVDFKNFTYARVLNGIGSYLFTSEEKSAIRTGDMLLFSFVVKADTSSPIEITVDVGTITNYLDKSMTLTYYVPTQWTRIYLPIRASELRGVTLKSEANVYLAEAKYENRFDATQEELSLESGMWCIEDFESYRLTEGGLGIGYTIGIVEYENYLYAIGDGKLSVIDTRTNKVIGSLSGLGNLRQIDITDDGRYVVVTGRQDGVYIIDVTTPTAPKILSTYNSIEFATGLFVSGNYALICNRVYGVEIVDISDPKNPRHLANIHSGEVQSCRVYNNILYANSMLL